LSGAGAQQLEVGVVEPAHLDLAVLDGLDLHQARTSTTQRPVSSVKAFCQERSALSCTGALASSRAEAPPLERTRYEAMSLDGEACQDTSSVCVSGSQVQLAPEGGSGAEAT